MGLFLATNERNFQSTKNVIARYEEISRAFLNISKIIIVPMYFDKPLPGWIGQTGCRVVNHKEVVTYLGCPIG